MREPDAGPRTELTPRGERPPARQRAQVRAHDGGLLALNPFGFESPEPLTPAKLMRALDRFRAYPLEMPEDLAQEGRAAVATLVAAVFARDCPWNFTASARMKEFFSCWRSS